MEDNDRPTLPKRRYPPIYEKVIPVALGVLTLAIVIVLLVILAVALGLLP